jgi:hypothetical protein
MRDVACKVLIVAHETLVHHNGIANCVCDTPERSTVKCAHEFARGGAASNGVCHPLAEHHGHGRNQ